MMAWRNQAKPNDAERRSNTPASLFLFSGSELTQRMKRPPSEAASRLAALADDIAAFRHYLKAERGMAANTVLAYGRDLDRFALWVGSGGLEDYLQPTVRALAHYLSHLREEGLAPASMARHLVALKMFYRFLRVEERASASAVELLSSPNLWERIPQVLSPESVE